MPRTYRVDDRKGDGVNAERANFRPSLMVKCQYEKLPYNTTHELLTLPMNHWIVVGTIPMSKLIGMTKYGPFGP